MNGPTNGRDPLLHLLPVEHRAGEIAVVLGCLQDERVGVDGTGCTRGRRVDKDRVLGLGCVGGFCAGSVGREGRENTARQGKIATLPLGTAWKAEALSFFADQDVARSGAVGKLERRLFQGVGGHFCSEYIQEQHPFISRAEEREE